MKYRKYIAGLILLQIFFAQSCKKPIPLNIKEKEKKIVINSLLSNNDTIIKISLSKSKSILDDSDVEYINNANIILSENDIVLPLSDKDNEGNYYFYHKVIAGKTYKVEVSADNLKTAKAKTTIPNNNNFELIDTSTINYYEIENINFKIRIYDTETNSYYLLEVYNGENIVYLNTVDISAEEDYYGDEILFNNIIAGPGNLDFQFFAEKYSFYSYDDYGNIIDTETTAYIKLYKVHKAYYKYKHSVYNQNTSIENPFSEPVQIYNNIENGLGIFTSQNCSVDSVIVRF